MIIAMQEQAGDLNLNRLVHAISEREGTTYKLEQRLDGGEQGAWVISNPEGCHYILKVDQDHLKRARYERAAEATERLRAVSYPAPRYVATGSVEQGSYAIIEALPGRPRRTMPESAIPALVRLNESQRGQALTTNHAWVREIVDSILVGNDGYCVVETLLHHSDETAALLRVLERIASDSAGLDVPVNDIVHFDFNPANILFNGDPVTGVVDWDGTCSGDCSFDLATLLFYCYDHPAYRGRLVSEIVDRSGHGALRLYLAHMILRQIDWTIRHHDEGTVRHYLRRSKSILDGDPRKSERRLR
jgi:hypothetical protein